MSMVEAVAANYDDEADAEIRKCLDPANPRSFLLYAGAGSGKTRSLKNALDAFRNDHGAAFRRQGRKIAVITYTNAAADEIAERVGADPLFPISTIHSFCWRHIGSFHADIREWLLKKLPDDLAEEEEKYAKGRAGTKAATDRERKIATLTRRIEWLGAPRRFTYNPNGNNFGRDSLSHTEVLKIASDFIETKPSMQAILTNRYPFLLIDESQDTNKALLEAFISLAKENEGRFAVGLFGDMMQRIFFDGHPELERLAPENWARLEKRVNHRSPKRIVELGNTLRKPIDKQSQAVRADSETGIVRLFVASSDTHDKPALERQIRERMAKVSNDTDWSDPARVKALTLEHRMAASRGGFLAMFDALDQGSRLSNGVRKGELAGLRFFTERIAPLIAAARANDAFALMSHLRAHSPILKRNMMTAGHSADDHPLLPARTAVNALLALKPEDPTTTYLDMLRCVAEHNLFEIPEALQPFVKQHEGLELEPLDVDVQEPIDVLDKIEIAPEDTASQDLDAWRSFMETSYNQTDPYTEYIADRGPFGTHQGVKGLEFERVFVILDDEEARGNLFSYEKLLDAKPLSDRDHKHLVEGTEGSLIRTRRLLYVTCTRARKSLALLAYTNNSDALIKSAHRDGLFIDEEIERCDGFAS